MAIEKLFSRMRQDALDSASGLSEEQAHLLREGKVEDAEQRMNQVKIEIAKAKKVNRIVADMLDILRAAGFEQPPAEYLEQVVAREVSTPEPVYVKGQKSGLFSFLARLFPSKQEQIFIPGRPISPLNLVEEVMGSRPVVEETSEEVKEIGDIDREGEEVVAAVPTPPIEAKRVRGDFVEREEKLVYAALAVNPNRDGFQFESWRSVWRQAFSDAFENITDERERDDKEKNSQIASYSARSAIIVKLQRVKTNAQDIPPKVASFLEWVKTQPEYVNLSVDDISLIIQRQITFDEIRQKASQAVNILQIESQPTEEQAVSGEQTESVPQLPSIQASESRATEPQTLQLTGPELHLLAQKLLQAAPAVLERTGIRIHTADREEIGGIMGRLASSPETLRASETSLESLTQKLAAYLKDKEKVFMENVSNEDAQYLITFVAGISSEDLLKEFLSS